MLRDAAGVIRAQLNIADNNAVLVLYGPQGSNKGTVAELGAGPTGPFVHLENEQLRRADFENDSLKFYDNDGNNLMTLLANDTGGSLAFQTPDKHLEAAISALPDESFLIINGRNGGSSLKGNSLDINDKDGFSTQIGHAELVIEHASELQKAVAVQPI